MNKRLIEIECPFCHHSFTMVKDTFLIRDPGSQEYRQIKEGTFFTHICSKCHQPFYLHYPLLYRDPVQGFRLALLGLNQSTASLEKGTVVTRDPLKFLKAFSILDSGLEIQKILPYFAILKQKTGEDWKISEYDQDNGILWFECGDKITEIRLYEQDFFME